MHFIFVIFGYLSTIMAFIVQLPQVITVIKHKSAKNISYPYIGLILIDCIFYVIYGTGFILDYELEGIPIILAGIVPFLVTTLLLILKIFFTIRKKRIQHALELTGRGATKEEIDSM